MKSAKPSPLEMSAVDYDSHKLFISIYKAKVRSSDFAISLQILIEYRAIGNVWLNIRSQPSDLVRSRQCNIANKVPSFQPSSSSSN